MQAVFAPTRGELYEKIGLADYRRSGGYADPLADCLCPDYRPRRRNDGAASPAERWYRPGHSLARCCLAHRLGYSGARHSAAQVA